MFGNFYNETVMTHSFIEDDETTQTCTVTTRADCWSDLFRSFIRMLRAAGYYPNREGFEEILLEEFGYYSDEVDEDCTGEPEF